MAPPRALQSPKATKATPTATPRTATRIMMSDCSISDNEEVEPIAYEPKDRSEAAHLQGAGHVQEKVVNWTVKDAGVCKVPTTNNYAFWNIQQLRRECTARGKKIARGGSGEKDMRVAYLRENDNDRQLLLLAIDPELAKPSRLRKTEHSAVRLVNILLSDEFVATFIRTQDQLPRDAIDRGEKGTVSPFWKSVAAAFTTNKHDFNGLAITDDPRFDGLDPSIIVPHDAATLLKMWKEMRDTYRTAYKNPTKSGEHDDDFHSYCNGRLDIAYLHYYGSTKHADVLEFVRTVMPASAQLDSSKPQPRPGPKAKRGRRESTDNNSSELTHLQKTLQILTDVFVEERAEKSAKTASTALASRPRVARSAAEIQQCIETAYKILNPLQARLEDLQAMGRSDSMVKRSVEIQKAAIRKLETEFMARMGIACDEEEKAENSDDDYVVVV